MLKNLIIKYLDGEITHEEEKELYSLLKESEDNRIIFREVEGEWAESHKTTMEARRIQELLSRKGKTTRNKKLIFSSILAIAAAMSAAFLIDRTIINSSTTPEPLFYTMTAPMGTHSKLSLPDGSVVWLNAGSSLRYSSDFGISERNISLEGEAYFEVSKNEKLPFRVSAGGCLFSVLGTEFDIQAYEGDDNVTAVLMQGSLRCDISGNTEYMTPGDMVIIGEDSILRKDRVNANQYRSWIDGLICYDKIELPALLKKLSREYNVDIRLITNEFNSRTLHVSFASDVPIETILKAISETVPIRVTLSGKTYTVDSK
ncbi:MAG: FecR domain-containing protein [Bacteroidales bacterium]|nr:FecR domain-containing protein [Bacteroidales bacterium]